ncbi:MAG TPA: CHASE2 and HATPase_c domain-containing protein, partial [Bryobacteraceae bacterium]|nr:CHASE2 and HATPase_c domain-containing protein [Bryobacteraceae bacterium]
PAFAAHAAAIGHVHALAGPFDEVNRRIPLEKVSARERLWALSLEALRLQSSASPPMSSPTDVTVGRYTFQSRWDQGRPFRIRYRLPGDMETVSVRDLLSGAADPAGLKGRVVFVGVTSLSAIRDRLFTPVALDRPMAGVEIHAQAFETLAAGSSPGGTLREASLLWTVLLAFAFALLMAGAFVWLQGHISLAAGLLVLAAAQLTPYLFFRQGWILPAFAPVSASATAFIACGAWRFLIVRKQLASSESARSRYQQAFHFVAHEMRTPLTAIQGSSELISRYNLPEEKRKQIGQMINSESKRLARMITTFLDVERLNAGLMELNTSDVDAGDLILACIARAAGLAEAKSIQIDWPGAPGLTIRGDTELLGYAIYNLLTNAIKYSPRDSRISVSASRESRGVLISVADQGIGMTKDEVKRLFQKFYRTERAEKSGIQGTGIGLSIVKEIVTLHGGSICVDSAPDQGSTFVVTLPVHHMTEQ